MAIGKKMKTSNLGMPTLDNPFPNLNTNSNNLLSQEFSSQTNQQNLSTVADNSNRRQGIANLLFALSDAFAGRDIGTGFLERQRFLQPKKEKLTAAQQNLQAFYKIYNNPNATQEDKRFALSLIGGIGKSKKQLREEVAKSLVTAVNPVNGLPYTKDEINQQLELFDELLPNSNKNKPNEPTPTNIFKVGGYTIEGG
jgi:hypothetical protein